MDFKHLLSKVWHAAVMPKLPTMLKAGFVEAATVELVLGVVVTLQQARNVPTYSIPKT